ncbi:diacylglycerol kinase eta isoform X5 [Nilaparvata lugens]|uniref:diacylglycerol kinase eta isoform X4 n=1 Tax=Nilaparvata lugens TaxID=108931 RepID=UPI00193E99E9|nr:diacylglycerol kinase eta isoform X4 [Nilaparvata lugens]XP_039295840.1 diacylglycerol kinase eta isoform X5 [Nilaparvata lugens]
MDDWIAALKTAAATRTSQQVSTDIHNLLSGQHSWNSTSHARPIYCNICGDALSGVTIHGYSCSICKFKIHKRCASKAINNCKWTTLASVGKHILEDKDGNIRMPHQWMEGNLPVSSKCAVCDKTCGSVLKLLDWRCLWCRATVHTACRPSYPVVCPLGPCRVSVVPPIALHSIGTDDAWEAIRPTGCSPLLVFVNSKSGDNQGVKFLRRFKQLLNPAQVFDLITNGPGPGLKLFRHFDPFRILVCSGDGSVGWVLSEIDRLNMQHQCHVGVLPLGTGNDLARVLGWGSACDDDTHLPQLVDKYEKASTKILDRWSIMTFERSISIASGGKLTLNVPSEEQPTEEGDGEGEEKPSSQMSEEENTMLYHLLRIMRSDDHTAILASAKVLCESVKAFSLHAAATSLGQGDHAFGRKCLTLKGKLELLTQSLQDDEDSMMGDVEHSEEKEKFDIPEKPDDGAKEHKEQEPGKDRLITRANSLKRAIRQFIEHTEIAVDEQNKQKKRTMDSLKVGDCETMAPSLLTSPSMDMLANPMSISPLPDRRESACDPLNVPLESLPVPSMFADNRRGSDLSIMSQGDQSRRSSYTRQQSFDIVADVESSKETEENDRNVIIEADDVSRIFKRIRIPGVSLEDKEATDEGEALKAVLSGLIMPEEVLAKIGHIDSSETSDDSPEASSTNQKHKDRKRSLSEDRGMSQSVRRLARFPLTIDSVEQEGEGEAVDHPDEEQELDATNLISTSPDDDDEDDDELSLLLSNRGGGYQAASTAHLPVGGKRCSIAHFVEGSDIARRSIKCRHKNLNLDQDLDVLEAVCREVVGEAKGGTNLLGVPTIHVHASDDESNVSSDDNRTIEAEFPYLGLIGGGGDSTARNLTPSSLASGSPRLSISPTNDDAENDDAANDVTIEDTDDVIKSMGPTVIIDPPSPPQEGGGDDIDPTSTAAKKDDDLLDNRRPSYDYCRKLSAASPLSLLHFSPSPSRRISSVSLIGRSDSTEQTTPTAHTPSKDSDKDKDKNKEKELPIINPLVRLPTWPNVSSIGMVSKALLANADALCAAAVPLMDPDETLMEGFYEKCVMNNYFGIGIDAKISLDFHNKREEHPEKCRSRARNYMWYGVLGSKEWLQKTYKNLEQRVQLECDGQRIPLPSLQGIVILNIPSFMGGTNFWGGTKEDDIFLAPSIDDKILEVVAVFGSVQMAASRLINLQHHRIAQCQTVQINILGDEGVPIQVDGEAWIQPPGMIRIIHKNRMKMLCRNRALESSLKAWEEKQRQQALSKTPRRQSTTPASLTIFCEEEMQLLMEFIEATSTLIRCVKFLTINHPSMKSALYEIADQCQVSLEKVHPGGKFLEGLELRTQLTELVTNTRDLNDEACLLLREKAQTLRLKEDLATQLNLALSNMDHEFRKCKFAFESETGQNLVYLNPPPADEERKSRPKAPFWLMKFRRGGGVSDKVGGASDKVGGASGVAGREAASWGVAEVAEWLDSLQLGEYADAFLQNDVRGRELLTLTRRDLKEMGVTKVGHVKRILQAVRELGM